MPMEETAHRIPATQTVNDGDIIAAAPTGISKTGFTLSTAWNTKADGSGDAFLFGSGGTPVTEGITLYAQWSNTQHTVTYHVNGGNRHTESRQLKQ